MTPSPNSDLIAKLRPYSVPRAVLVSLLFLFALVVRALALTPAVLVHVLERAADAAMACIAAMPPRPARHTRRNPR